MKTYRFKPQLIPTLACFALFLLLLHLGRWQWQRAEFKEDLERRYSAGAQSRPLSVKEAVILGHDLQSYPVIVTGEFDNAHTFLLDNQNDGTQHGMDVLTLLRTTDGSTVLVNRGWTALPESNLGQLRQMPSVAPTRAGMVTLTGKIYFPSEKQIVLKADDFSHPQWPFLLQKLDMPAIETLLGKDGVGVELAPFVVRLDAGQQVERGEQLKRHWQLIVMGPEKHRAYSFQWFAMALALFIFYVIFSTEKIIPDEHS